MSQPKPKTFGKVKTIFWHVGQLFFKEIIAQKPESIRLSGHWKMTESARLRL